MHPVDCPAWEYSQHPNCQKILTQKVARVVTSLLKRELDTREFAADSRGVHGEIFRELTPPGFNYFAGHYRGEPFRCLRFYAVAVKGDSRVGALPESVSHRVENLKSEIWSGISALDANVAGTPRQRLAYALALASRIFVAFLEIHPYANGNGHLGRLIVWALLGRYGYWPRRWPVHPRPQDPPYSNLIIEWRNGNTAPLEKFLLQCILP